MSIKIFLFILCLTSLFIQVVAKDYCIVDYGAIPVENHDNTKSIQEAIDSCFSEGGGTVVVPAGVWQSGSLILKSHVNICLENGATLQTINNNDAFPPIHAPIMSRENRKPSRAFVYAENASHIRIFGDGTIDGGGGYDIFKVHDEHGNNRKITRPFGIYMVECNNIRLEGIRMINSAMWMQRYQKCTKLTLTNLTIYNHSNLNNDGIDIDGCEDVIISNCNVDASDDALCLKAEGASGCKNIVVTNCILSSHATPLKLGTGSIGNFENIAISNIVIRPSKSKKMIHELKSWRGLSGIDILSVDGGIIDGLSINNVVMDSVETPIFIKLGNRNSSFPGCHAAGKGQIRNVRISKLTAKNCGNICSAITGYPGAMIENIYLSDIFVSVQSDSKAHSSSVDVPENSDGYPYNRMFGKSLPAYGLFVRHAQNITIDNFQLALVSPNARPALWFENARDVTLRGFKADKPEGESKLIVERGSEIRILE